MDHEALSFLRDIINNVEPQYKEHAIGAYNFYTEHECLTSGYLKTTKLNALKQGKIVPDALLPEYDREVYAPKPPLKPEIEKLVVELSGESDPDILEAVITLLQAMIKSKEQFEGTE